MRRARLAVIALVLLVPKEAWLSGATEKTLSAKTFQLSLSTPRKIFAPDPNGGDSGEARYHAEARDEFTRRLAAIEAPLKKEIDRLIAKKVAPIVRYDEALPRFDPSDKQTPRPRGPCRMELPVPWGSLAVLSLAFSRPPTDQERRALESALEAFFKQH